MSRRNLALVVTIAVLAVLETAECVCPPKGDCKVIKGDNNRAKGICTDNRTSYDLLEKNMGMSPEGIAVLQSQMYEEYVNNKERYSMIGGDFFKPTPNEGVCNETCLCQNRECYAKAIYIGTKWYLLAFFNNIQGQSWFQRLWWCWCDVKEKFECIDKKFLKKKVAKKYMYKCKERHGYNKVLVWAPAKSTDQKPNFKLVWKWVKTCNGCCCEQMKKVKPTKKPKTKRPPLPEK